MIIATLLRYMDIEGKEPFNERSYLSNHFVRMAKKFDVALLPLTTETSFSTICMLCSGLIIPGSSINVNPSYYGEEGTPQAVDEYAFDRKVIEAFNNRGKPILGVCGGMQALNVYFGGTLKRDILNHRRVKHDVSFSSGSFLEEVYEKNSLKVNSFHSQAVNEVAPSLEIAARASDGTIEAIQSKTGSIYGIQWHPEIDFSTADSDHSGIKIFKYFLTKCKAE